MESESNLVRHAKEEFQILGWPGDCEMQQAMCGDILELLRVFSDQGHSGFSAGYLLSNFEKLAKFQIISPLTGEDSEWNEVGEDVYQNRRASNVFKDSKTGQAYDIYGKVFRDPDGGCYTNYDSRVNVTFPYTPKKEYVDVSSDRGQNENV